MRCWVGARLRAMGRYRRGHVARKRAPTLVIPCAVWDAVASLIRAQSCFGMSAVFGWNTRAWTAAGRAVAAFDYSVQKGFGPPFSTAHMT
ncbi:hypothetical protein D0A39_01740 [Xanthomonas campestris pv. campestris]|nr:hypothetical protein D0A39_01740 [Xanthomonas campestris pv. campestris]